MSNNNLRAMVFGTLIVVLTVAALVAAFAIDNLWLRIIILAIFVMQHTGSLLYRLGMWTFRKVLVREILAEVRAWVVTEDVEKYYDIYSWGVVLEDNGYASPFLYILPKGQTTGEYWILRWTKQIVTPEMKNKIEHLLVGIEPDVNGVRTKLYGKP